MAPGFREETHYRVVARVGPSNVARIDALLALQGITAAGDRAQATRPRSRPTQRTGPTAWRGK